MKISDFKIPGLCLIWLVIGILAGRGWEHQPPNAQAISKLALEFKAVSDEATFACLATVAAARRIGEETALANMCDEWSRLEMIRFGWLTNEGRLP